LNDRRKRQYPMLLTGRQDFQHNLSSSPPILAIVLKEDQKPLTTSKLQVQVAQQKLCLTVRNENAYYYSTFS
jgi:hypothetical protein